MNLQNFWKGKRFIETPVMLKLVSGFEDGTNHSIHRWFLYTVCHHWLRKKEHEEPSTYQFLWHLGERTVPEDRGCRHSAETQQESCD